MNDIERAKGWVLAKWGDRTRGVLDQFELSDLPAGVSVGVLKAALSALTENGAIGIGSGAIHTDNAGYLLRIMLPAGRPGKAILINRTSV